MTYTIAVCTVKNSRWWTNKLSETCRVLFQKQIWEISASILFHYKNLSRWTVTWMSNKAISYFIVNLIWLVLWWAWYIFALYCIAMSRMPTLIPLMTETLLWFFLCTSCWWSSNSAYICYLHIIQGVLKLFNSYA